MPLDAPEERPAAGIPAPAEERGRGTVEEVEFWSGGRPRVALLHWPARYSRGEARPAAVLAHGLANDRDEAGQFGPLAERLVEEGHVVLRFDFRGGTRDLDPGRQLPASEWPHDLAAAVVCARGLPGVDASQVGVIGASCGGSVALVAAGFDPELRYVITLGCFADGADWLRGLWSAQYGELGWQRFLADVRDDRIRRSAGERSRRVPLAGGFLPVPDDAVEAVEELLRANPGMLRELSLETADDLLLLSPVAFAGRGVVPVLLVHGARDTLVPAADAERLEWALGRRATRVVLDEGLHQLLLGTSRNAVLDLVSQWIHER